MALERASQNQRGPDHKENVPVVVLGLSALGLNLMRRFTQLGKTVWGVECDRGEIGLCSRYGRKRVAPRPDTQPEALVHWLVRLGQSAGQRPVLMPARDPYVLFLARHAAALEPWFRFTIAPAGLVESLTDKAATAALLTAHGLPTPRTIVLDENSPAGDLAYPCIAKSRFADRRRLSSKGIHVPTPDVLPAVLGRARCEDAALVLQEFVPGADDQHYSFAAYRDATGKLLGSFTAHKVRQYPPQLGLGCLCESCQQPEVEQLGGRALAALGFRGLAEVEIKRDSRSGTWMVIEVNPRTWLQNELARACGVDLDRLAYREAIGLARRLPGRQKNAVRWIHLGWDFLTSAEEWLRGRLTPLAWLRSLGPVRVVAFADVTDPVPFLRHAWDTLATVGRALVRRFGPRQLSDTAK
jgi:predicted ATP-grasp superfamily ATP-dependent carboligase